MSELKTDLDILDFISKQPGRTVVADDLKAFIGENAKRRLSEMRQAGLVCFDPHWYDSKPMTYTLDAKGESLLATHEQEVEKEHQRMADVRAEQERQRVESDKESSQKRRFDLFSAIIGSVIGSVITIVGEIVIRLIFK